MRLKNVLPNIINNAQTGYLQGRFIGENIRLIKDIHHYTADQNLEGIALFIDFEKAFDSLEWEYLDKALNAFNFGHDFKVWVRTLYNNIFSCTINNGYLLHLSEELSKAARYPASFSYWLLKHCLLR